MALTTYRNTNKKWYYSPSTKRTANWLSSYMDGRTYKYSVYQQLLNMIAIQSDQMDSALARQLANRFPKTYMHDTMDVVNTIDNDPSLYKIQYQSNGQWIDINESDFTNVEDWWYNTLPTGIKVLRTQNSVATIVNNQSLSKIISVKQSFNPATCFYISLTSNTGRFVNNVYNENLTPTTLTVIGRDKQGNAVREIFTFNYSTYIKSNYSWSYIDHVDAEYFDDPSLFTLNISQYIDSLTQNYIEDALYRNEDDNKVKRPVLWHWDAVGGFLEQNEFAAASIQDLYAGIKDQNLIYKHKLLAMDSTNTLVPLATIDSFIPDLGKKNYVYVLSGGYLIAYHKYSDYPSLVKIATQYQTPDPIVNLDVELQSNGIYIKGIYNRLRVGDRILQYRFSIYDGSTWKTWQNPTTINSPELNNTLVAFSNTYWTDYELKNTVGFLGPAVFYPISGYLATDVIVRLEVQLTDGTIEADTFVLEKQIKEPLFQYPIANYVSGTKLSFDELDFLTLNNGTQQVRIDFRNDTFLRSADYNKIILAEKYDTFQKISGGITTSLVPRPFNVLTELDNYGALTSLNRKTGEKTYNYIERLNFAWSNSIGASRDGLINGISVELGLDIRNVLSVSNTLPFFLAVETEAASSNVDPTNTTINLFEFNTIQDIYDYLVAAGLTVTILEPDYMTLPARCLMINDNRKFYYDLRFNNQQKIIPNLEDSETIYNVSIEGLYSLGNVLTIDDVDLVTIPSFGIVNGKWIYSNVPLTNDNVVSLVTLLNKTQLKASPVIVSSLHAGLNYHFTYDAISNYAQKIMQSSDQLYPNKWSQ